MILSAAAMVFTHSCANIIPPQGGPRDTIPPVLVRAVPGDSTVNFRGNRITLEFDEFIDLKDEANNLIFAPLSAPGRTPVSARLRTLSVRFLDSLEPNTTYTLNFGNAVVDFNEGNPMRGFRYVFSTGPVIDTGTLTGRVVLAETGGIDTTLQVVLHNRLDDSAVIRQRPRYAARVDRTGAFRFTNLPRDTFAIYALGDAGLTRRYLTGTQAFAFSDSLLIVGESRPVTLYAWRAEAEGGRTAPAGLPGLGRGAAGAADRRLQFTPNTTGNVLDLQSDLVLSFPVPLRTLDSAGIALYRDSVFTPVPLTSVTLDTARTALRLAARWTESTAYALVLQPSFAEDTAGRRLLRPDTLRLVTRPQSEYGSLQLRFRNLAVTGATTALLIQNEKVVYSGPVTGGVFSRALLLPGEYEIRILEDANGNGRWDTGSFPDPKRQPERIRPVERRITVKPASHNEFELLF